MPYLRSQQLLGYVDGSIVCPSMMITTNTSAREVQTQNLAYVQWMQQDQLVLSALLSSFSEELLSHVLFLITVHDVWMTLEHLFASQSKARIMQIKMQLSTTKKELSVSAYFNKMKGLADTLTAIGQPLHKKEIVTYILVGLDSDYDPLVTSITTRSEAISFSDLYAHMLSFEKLIENHNPELQIRDSSANFASRNKGNGDRGNKGNGCDIGGPNAPRGFGGNTFGNNSCSFVLNNNNRTKCQVCGKIGQMALKCYHKFDHSYQAEDAHVAAYAVAPAYNIDTNWYSDIGATNHITSNLDRLTVRERYTIKDQVQVANYSDWAIQHSGQSHSLTSSRNLKLRNVLHVPIVTHNHSSVHRLATYNDIFFEFHPYHFFVKDQAT